MFVMYVLYTLFFFFFFNDTATTEIYTLSLHDALPICDAGRRTGARRARPPQCPTLADRKSTRLNSSHSSISYAVFCLKKKKKRMHHDQMVKRKTYMKNFIPLAGVSHHAVMVRFGSDPKTSVLFFFFNDTAPTEIYTLSLHDALPILPIAMEEKLRFAIREGGRTVGSGVVT